ncbi:MAG TPA: ABC transporter ATP-binding protein [Candidatus Acidoferrum sp.]|jgi:putative ABC transport system ATP-binding protein|nr:ABC transporter ATP-binding protein [Candidatus Acidoferrum sp.]
MIEVTNLGKTYRRGDGTPVEALKDISFLIERGEFVTIRGPSGSGKSSMLNIVGCLDKPTSGAYRLNGEELSGYSDKQLSHVRAWKIGFVFQSFNLMPRTTALENVEIPMIYGPGRVDRNRAMAALERVGLGERAHHYGTELSGGEQQRVAIARALINDPPLILADEPTGNLDSVAGAEVMGILRQLHQEGRTVVLVTHDDAVAAYAEREILFKDGVLASDRKIAVLATE